MGGAQVGGHQIGVVKIGEGGVGVGCAGVAHGLGQGVEIPVVANHYMAVQVERGYPLVEKLLEH